MNAMHEHGTLAQWCGSFGFIAPDKSDSDIFINYDELALSGATHIAVGDRVAFARRPDDRDPRKEQATRVYRLQGQPPQPMESRVWWIVKCRADDYRT
jgi:cold shock CspA family protein